MSGKKQNPPKSQHFLPQMYLQKFCNSEGLLWRYDKKTDEFKELPPRVVGVDNDAYTIVEEDGTKRTEIESFFCHIEGQSKPALDKADTQQHLTIEDKALIAIFISFMKVRSPSFIGQMIETIEDLGRWVTDFEHSDENALQQTIESYEQATGQELKCSARDMMDDWEKGAITVKANKNFVLRTMIDVGRKQVDWLGQFEWIFQRTPDSTAFVTSDSAFALLPPPDHPRTGFYAGVGLATPGAIKLISLSPKACLMITKPGENILHGRLTKEEARKTNLVITLNADRFVIGRDEQQLRYLVKRWKNLRVRGSIQKGDG